MKSNLEFKRGVMTRVYAIYALRRLTEPLVFKAALFAAFLIALLSTVSIYHIFANMLSSGGNVMYFFTSAFSNSEQAVKLIVVLEFIVLLTLLKDAIYSLNGKTLRGALNVSN